MARMKELEGEVLELLKELGDNQYLAELSGHTITPENFLGIEINPRAAAIAQEPGRQRRGGTVRLAAVQQRSLP